MRKDSTIISLQAKVSRLQRTMDEMQQLFCQFNDSAMASGIFQQRPSLADELKATTQRFIELSKAAETDFEDEEGEAGRRESEVKDNASNMEQPSPIGDLAILSARTISSPASLPPPKTSTQPGYTHIGFGLCRNDDISHEQQAPPPEPITKSQRDPTGYNSFTFYPPRPSDTDISSMLKNSVSSNTALARVQHQHYQQWQRQQNQQEQCKVNVPSMTDFYLPDFVSKPIISSYIVNPFPECLDFTQGSNEPTFTRRLIRVSYTGGYNLLLQSYLRPHLTSGIFKFFLALHTREMILEHMYNLLTGDSLDCPEYWEIPFVNLGGAGTHYPLRDDQGNIIPRKNNLHVVPTGQGNLARLILGDTSGDTGVVVDLTDYDNEDWFDANDVDCFLRERGIHIGPGDDFVAVDIPAWLLPVKKPTTAAPSASETTTIRTSTITQTSSINLSDNSSLTDSSNLLSSMDQNSYFPTASNGFPQVARLLASPPETPLPNLSYSGSNGSTSQSISPQEAVLGNNITLPTEQMVGIDPIINPAATFDGLLFPEDKSRDVDSGINNFSQFINGNMEAANHIDSLGYKQPSLGFASDSANGGAARSSIVSAYETALQLQPRQRVQIDVLELVKGK